MKTRTFIIFCLAALAMSASAIAVEPSPSPKPIPLYIHCIGPNSNGDNSCVRLLTVRVRCSEDIEVVMDRPSPVLSLTGRIEPRGDKFFVQIAGQVGGSTGDFDGEVELDKRYYPPRYMGNISNIRMFSFVLSHNSDPTPHLKSPFFKIGESKDFKPEDAKPK